MVGDVALSRADWRPYAAFAGMCCIWGSTFLVIALGNDAGLPPVWAATLRLTLAAPLLALLARATGGTYPRGASLRDVAIYGFLQLGVNFALLYWGEQVVPSGLTAVVYATIPLSTSLFAWSMGVERLHPVRTAAAIVALGGVAVIFAGQIGAGVPLLGLVAVFSSATSAALSSVFLKRARATSPFAVNAIGAAIGAVTCFAVSLALGERIALPTTFASWWPILYLTLAGSLGAYVLLAWLIRHWSATNTSMIGVVIPVVALTLGAIVRAERPAAIEFVGAGIVIASVVVSLWKGH